MASTSEPKDAESDKNSPLIVRASAQQLSACPIKLTSNRDTLLNLRPDMPILTAGLQNLTVTAKEKPPPEKTDHQGTVYIKGEEKSVFLIMPHPCKLQFCGHLSVEVLHGRVVIFGSELSRDSRRKSLKLFGSFISNAIVIETKQPPATDSSSLKHILETTFPRISQQILDKFQPGSSVILIKELPLPALYLSKQYVPPEYYPTYENFTIYPEISKWMDCRIDTLDGTTYHPQITPESWQNIPLSKSMMVIGGGGHGKSMLTKFLVNRLLNNNNHVMYFELDVGQSDFIAPGTIAAILIRDPVVGTGWTHQLHPETMIHLGHVDVLKCIKAYYESVAILNNKYKENSEEIPLVINTKGFISGIGFDLTKTIIETLKPSTLIQIESVKKPGKNFKTHFTRNVVKEVADDFQHLIVSEYSYPENQIRMSEKKGEAWKKKLRNLKTLSLWNSLLRPPHYTFDSVSPFRVSFSSIIIGVGHKSLALQDILKALNGSLVALCGKPMSNLKILEANSDYFQIVLKPNFQECLAIGLVRGIDVEKKELYLISPLTPTEMRKVQMLTISNVAFPDEIFEGQLVSVTVPYLTRYVHVRTSRLFASISPRNRPRIGELSISGLSPLREN